MIIAKLTSLLVVLLALCVPVSVAIGASAMLPWLLNPVFPANPQFLVRSIIGGVDSTPVLALPLFVLSGLIMARGQISEKLFNMFAFLFGRFKCSIPIVALLTCLFYGATTGSAPATTAAVGAMVIPIMVELGYDKVFVTSMVATAGGLGVILPPSIPFILFAQSSGESVGRLFVAGIIPGILVAICLMVYAYYYCRKHGEDEEKINAYIANLRSKGFFKLAFESLLAFMSPVIILGGIYGGIVTPTEAACISVFYALFICCFIYRTLSFSDVVKLFRDAVCTYGPILFVLGTAVAFGRVLALLQAPQAVVGTITSLVQNRFAVLIMVNIFLLLIGLFVDAGPAILILTPILMPLMRTIGVDGVHFGVIMVVNLAIGFVTPPVGVNLFVASAMTKVPIHKLYVGAFPFVLSLLVALALITFIPALSLWLL